MLQLCVMPAVKAAPALAESVQETVMDMELHDCCLDNTPILEMDETCPECVSISSALKIQPLDNAEPIFALLYVVAPLVITQPRKLHQWLSNTEPDMLALRPDIYLANATFLE
ncbi:hypothetical protein M3P05_13005 [Sansalvadorimonas sp. 2012CJ34-2]|uniref:Uncharacterized protein n=1 Tax=Parendozoicomonas callyspongiae TaxID=2942213 RepID=A0ABT0PHH9_9GAMM|nr:hypothetical protein [Sansalvadorimonas sp. 2012CJ34-2]MCL6270842.1 hypothetical protein [Sansalvadorimonas sp. 2012CJ34-2]